MLVRVNNENKQIMLDYVTKEPTINLFIIGDVEQFGLDVDFQEVYLQYDNDKITACVLRYYGNIVVYSDINDFDVKEIVNLLNTFSYSRLSGKKTVVDLLVPHLRNIKVIDECYFCELGESDK